MKKNICHSLILLLLVSIGSLTAQNGSLATRQSIARFLNSHVSGELAIGKITVDSLTILDKAKKVRVVASVNCSYIPFTQQRVEVVYDSIRNILPSSYASYKVELVTDNQPIENLVTGQSRKYTFRNKVDKPLVTALSKPFKAEKGLRNKHIALWQSHGFYFEQKLNRWEWQRARIFQTVEDLYTQSYVLPFLVPMLENAGANVLLPRERDTQTLEVIVDNDKATHPSVYKEIQGDKPWSVGFGKGFAMLKDQYIETENPFQDGTFRQTVTRKKGKESLAEWIPSLSKAGKYAVYVSYKTLPESTEDALYTVYHKGGKSQFRVNQQMGGGTWIYLGHFMFDQGMNESCKVQLSNLSSKNNRIVTADGVKIGGGYGTIARKVNNSGIVSENTKSSDNSGPKVLQSQLSIPYQYEVSGYPRFTEGARYWLQYAGFPDTVYTQSKGVNDYTDDYKSRGVWVNYLSGGSSVAPKEKGLNIPVDLAFAFHTDAGTTLNDSIIGTLGIFFTKEGDETFGNKASRYVSRDLTDLIQTEIVKDIRSLYEPAWSRRGMWNQSYFEARTPRVPTMLLELLSHQNFADMRYGLDPRFRFTVSRAIYKGMLKFIALQYNQPFVVQPLPVDHFSVRFTGAEEVELGWQAVRDSLEPTAVANKYILYTRKGNADFDNGVVVTSNKIRLHQEPGIIYSYKVTALNEGGESFPSEVLSACRVKDEKGVVLVVNGFDRVSGPADFVADSIAGFYDPKDHGVPYLNDISFIGSQYEFRRSKPWTDDDAPGFGASRANYETKVIAGNSFDYPALHGQSIVKAGYSFVSSSDESVGSGKVNLMEYPVVDLILGKERQTQIGRGVFDSQFKTFPAELQQTITAYCNQGGNVLVSGAYVGTDLWDNGEVNVQDLDFAKKVLKYNWRTGQASVTGEVKSVQSPFRMISGHYEFYNELNEHSYVVESPDAIEPADPACFTIYRYSENNLSAGVAYKGKYKTCVLGFPIETLKSDEQRDKLMADILLFMSSK